MRYIETLRWMPVTKGLVSFAIYWKAPRIHKLWFNSPGFIELRLYYDNNDERLGRVIVTTIEEFNLGLLKLEKEVLAVFKEIFPEPKTQE